MNYNISYWSAFLGILMISMFSMPSVGYAQTRNDTAAFAFFGLEGASPFKFEYNSQRSFNEFTSTKVELTLEARNCDVVVKRSQFTEFKNSPNLKEEISYTIKTNNISNIQIEKQFDYWEILAKTADNRIAPQEYVAIKIVGKDSYCSIERNGNSNCRDEISILVRHNKNIITERLTKAQQFWQSQFCKGRAF